MIDWKIEGLGEDGNVIIFHLRGEVDKALCEFIFSVLEYHIEQGRTNVVLNCYDLKFISSMGLGVLMHVHSRMKKQGGNVRLARVQSAVAHVLKLVMLDKILHIYPTVHEAVASFENDQ